jgi:hypothetical protein
MTLMKEHLVREARTTAQNLCRVAGAAALGAAKILVGGDVLVCAAPAVNDFILHATNHAARVRSTHVQAPPFSLR